MPAFELDANWLSPEFIRPEILTHPQIPGDLAGINPRTLMGSEWWDTMRKQAYSGNKGFCWACGGHSNDDPYHSWLEAHECYDFDYDKGVMSFKEVVALCHCCHCFIHSGRLWSLYDQGTITKGKIRFILDTRLRMLRDAGLRPFLGTMVVYYMLQGMSEMQAKAQAWTVDMLPWLTGPKYPNKWKMVFNGWAYYADGRTQQWTE